MEILFVAALKDTVNLSVEAPSVCISVTVVNAGNETLLL